MEIFKTLLVKEEEKDKMPKVNGYAYYCTDSNVFYIDHNDESNQLVRTKFGGTDAEVMSNLPTIDIESTDGETYTANIPWLTELTSGMCFIVKPNMNSTSSSPMLNINNLGDKSFKRPLSTNGYSSTNDVELVGGIPYLISYSFLVWRVMSLIKPAATDLDGVVPVEKGGTGVTTLPKNPLPLLFPKSAYCGDDFPPDIF